MNGILVDGKAMERKGGPQVLQGEVEAECEVTVPNTEGLHSRPIMRFVDAASTFQSRIQVENLTLGHEPVDGKSAMQMMLLEATQGSKLRIQASGSDANEAVATLSALVEGGFDADATRRG